MGRKAPRSNVSPAANALPATSSVSASGCERVTFSRAHTHRGVPYAKGETYAATRAERELFLRFDVIEAE